MKGNRQGSLSRSVTRRSDQNGKIKCRFYCISKTTRWASGSKKAAADEKNKTPSAIVGMRSGNYKLQNKGRPFKNEVAKTV